MKNGNLAVREKFVAAVFAGDTAKIRANLHPDFVMRQDRALPYGGEYRGADGFLTFLQQFMATFDIQQLENTRTFVGENPDVAVFEFAFQGRVKATSREFATTLLEIWEFKDGKVLTVKAHWFELPTGTT